MEPINYRDALRRRWPVIVAIALVGAIIGGLFPASAPYPAPHTEYEALDPDRGDARQLPGRTGCSPRPRIKFYAANEQVIANAAKAIGIKGSRPPWRPTSCTQRQEEEESGENARRRPPDGREAAVGQALGQADQRLCHRPHRLHQPTAGGQPHERPSGWPSRRCRTWPTRSNLDQQIRRPPRRPPRRRPPPRRPTTTTTAPSRPRRCPDHNHNGGADLLRRSGRAGTGGAWSASARPIPTSQLQIQISVDITTLPERPGQR